MTYNDKAVIYFAGDGTVRVAEDARLHYDGEDLYIWREGEGGDSQKFPTFAMMCNQSKIVYPEGNWVYSIPEVMAVVPKDDPRWTETLPERAKFTGD